MCQTASIKQEAPLLLVFFFTWQPTKPCGDWFGQNDGFWLEESGPKPPETRAAKAAHDLELCVVLSTPATADPCYCQSHG